MATRQRQSKAHPPAPSAPQKPAELTTYGPPDGRRSWSRSADLGHPGYAPPASERTEDEMSEVLVRNGFKARSLLNDQARLENYDAHFLIYDGFAKHGQIHLHMLGSLLQDVAVRQSESRPQVGPSTYRLPQRVTVNDTKRDAWIADLANPDVPLSKLASASLPHPYKGHDLLDMLYKNSVPLDRAVWYVRVLGAHETHAMRTRPNFNPAQYSVDWTTVVTGHLKKQLADIMLPTPLRAGVTIRQPFQGVLGEVESRDKWLARFTYCLDLLRRFVEEGLVDQPTFANFLATLMSSCNLAQMEFVVRLSEEHFDMLLERRAFLAPFLDSCLTRLAELESNSLKEQLDGIIADLGSFLQRALLFRPDTFVHPRWWSTHGQLLRSVFIEKPEASVAIIADLPRAIPELCASLKQEYEKVSARVDALLFRNLPPREANALRSTLADIKLLNSTGPSTHFADLNYFSSIKSFTIETFRPKLHTLLTWASTSQCGDHKHYAAATILTMWCEEYNDEVRRKYEKRQHGSVSNTVPPTPAASSPAFHMSMSTAPTLPLKLNTNIPPAQVQAIPLPEVNPAGTILHRELLDWLDSSDIAGDIARHGRAVSVLFGELVRKRLFDYADFSRRVVVARTLNRRASSSLASAEEQDRLQDIARRREHYARCIPLVDGRSSLRADRSAALYGRDRDLSARAGAQQEEGDEDENDEERENALRIRLVQAFPALFPDWELAEEEVVVPSKPLGVPSEMPSGSSVGFGSGSAGEDSASVYVLAEVGYRWLLPAVWNFVNACAEVGPLPVDSFINITKTLAAYQCHPAILDLAMLMIRSAFSLELTQVALDTLRIHLDVWTSMNALDETVESVRNCSLVQEEAGLYVGPLAAFIRDVGALRQGGAHSATNLTDESVRKNVSHEASIPVIPEIVELIRTPALPATITLAIRQRYDPSTRWTFLLWESVLFTIQRLGSTLGSHATWFEAALRLVQVMSLTGSELSPSLDYETRLWFLGRGHRLLSTFDEGMWSIAEFVLSRLVRGGVLSVCTIMESIACPTWSAGLTRDETLPPQLVIPIRRTTNLASHLVLDLPLPQALPEEYDVSLAGSHHVRGQLGMITERSEVVAIFKGIANLGILEHHRGVPDDLAVAMRSLRKCISALPPFKILATRFIEDVRGLFTNTTSINVTGTPSEDTLLETLEMLIMPPSAVAACVNNITTPRQHVVLDFDAIIPLMTPWNFSTAVLELQLSFKRLAIAFSDEKQRPEAERAIGSFAESFFEHTLDAAQTDLVADCLQGMHGILAKRFFESGLERLSQLLVDLRIAFDDSRVDDFLRSAGEVLRLLAAVLQPLRANQQEPALEHGLHRRMITGLSDCFQLLVTAFTHSPEDLQERDAFYRFFERAMLILRVVQFQNAFPVKESSGSNELLVACLSLLLTLHTQTRLTLDSSIMYSALDTVCLLQSNSPKGMSLNNLRSHPLLDALNSPGQLPIEVSERLTFLTSQKTPDWKVAGVYQANTRAPVPPDPSKARMDESLQSRPWEWMPYRVPHLPEDTVPSDPLASPPPVVNNTALSLQHFVARITGEPARRAVPSELEASELESRYSRDIFHSESAAERDWRDGRVGRPSLPADTKEEAALLEELVATPSAITAAASPGGGIARSPVTTGTGGQSSAPASPVSTSSSSHTGKSASGSGVGRGARPQLSSLRNEIRMPGDGVLKTTSLYHPGYGHQLRGGLPAYVPQVGDFSSTIGASTSASAAGGVPRPAKRKMTHDADALSVGSSSSAQSLPYQSQPSRPAPQRSQTVAGASTATAMNVLRGGVPAPAGLPPRPMPAAGSRHPLPVRPQLVASGSASAASGAVRSATLPDPSSLAAAAGAAGKRKRDPKTGATLGSPVGALDPKKRRV